MNTKNFLSAVLLISVLSVLPACKWFGGKSESCPTCEKGEHEGPSAEDKVVVVSVDGKSVATVADIKEAFNAIRCQQPMFDQIFNMMPADQKMLVYKQILESFGEQYIVSKHVADMKWDRTECYRRVAEEMHKMLDRQLAVNEFRKRIIEETAALISDKDAEEYYMKNRERMRQVPFMANAGGIETVAVRFAREADAKAFLDKVRQAKDIRRVATEAKQQLIEMGIVTPQSAQHDYELVGKILSAKTVPAFDMVAAADKKSFFVFHAIRKVDAQFAPYAQVAAKVKEVMASERFPQEYAKRMADLKAKHKIDINQEFIQSRTGGAVKTAPAAPAAA